MTGRRQSRVCGSNPASAETAARRAWSIRPADALAALAVGALVIGTLLRPPQPLLLWNASPSGPEGLYAVTPARNPGVGDIVIAWPPPAARQLADRRRYLPRNIPLVKRVAARQGSRVCARGERIFIDGKPAATRRAADPSGRPMPWWSGCRLLGLEELFLLSNAPEAFDGRYFGITSANEVIGTATLLWRK